MFSFSCEIFSSKSAVIFILDSWQYRHFLIVGLCRFQFFKQMYDEMSSGKAFASDGCEITDISKYVAT
jgi:hypothetical protein